MKKELGGQHFDPVTAEPEGAERPSARPWPCVGVGAGGGRTLPPRGSGGITPGKILKLQMLAGEFWRILDT